MNNKKCKGSVTVFFSLVFILIAALLGTMAEGARVIASRSISAANAETALNNILAHYCRELWEDYHILFVEGDMVGGDEGIKEKINSYLKFACSPEIELQAGSMTSVLETSDFSGLHMICSSIEKDKLMEDKNGQNYIDQALSYQKYAEGEQVLDSLLKDLSDASGNDNKKRELEAVQKKVEMEQKLSEAELDITRIIEGMDGVQFRNGTITRQKDGSPKTTNLFVKKLCFKKINQTEVGVQDEIIYRALAEKYIDGFKLLDDMENMASEQMNKTEQNKNLINAGTQNTLTELQNEFVNSKEKIISAVIETESSISKVLADINKLQAGKIKYTDIIDDYRESLSSSATQISDDLHRNLESDLNQMEHYTSKSQSAFLQNIQAVLNKNSNILNQFSALANCNITSSKECVKTLRTLKDLKANVKEYSFSSICFDYNSYPSKKMESPISYFKKLMNDGLLNLLLENPDELSKAEITQMDTALDSDQNLLTILADCEEGNPNNTSLTLDKFQFMAEQKMDSLLFTRYLEQHFKHWDLEKMTQSKDSALSYELEYMISGKKSDKENFAACLYKILLTRTLTNFLYLMTDSEKNAEAQEAAVLIAGLFGISPLTILLKTLILMVWAVEEGIVELRVLLDGEKIQLIKTKQNFMTSFQDLLLLNKEKIQNQARKMEQEEVKAGINYQGFLIILMMTTGESALAERSIHLIEKNMQLRYSKDFKTINCFAGISAEIKTIVKPRFFNLLFIRKLLPNNISEMGEFQKYYRKID